MQVTAAYDNGGGSESLTLRFPDGSEAGGEHTTR